MRWREGCAALAVLGLSIGGDAVAQSQTKTPTIAQAQARALSPAEMVRIEQAAMARLASLDGLW